MDRHEEEARLIVTHVLGHGDLDADDWTSVAEVERRLRAAERRGAERVRAKARAEVADAIDICIGHAFVKDPVAVLESVAENIAAIDIDALLAGDGS